LYAEKADDPMMDYEGAKQFILEKLSRGLPEGLLYHNIEHTLDVLQSAERLATLERVNGYDLTLLKTAALFHDSGMLIRYEDHELASTQLTKEYLPHFGYSEEDIRVINDMILTTRLPQSAQSNIQKILCDADLDYLGRDDFFIIAHRLQYEWNTLKVNVTTLIEWYQLQLNFLSTHTYYTHSAIRLRQEKKDAHLAQVRQLLGK
jgi:predicted metal-dependent HD superfamily phosphohydrolase